MAIMEGTDPKEKLKASYWDALKANWMLWPLVQAINFRFVPVSGQVLVVNVVSLGECFLFYLAVMSLKAGDGWWGTRLMWTVSRVELLLELCQ